MEFVTIENFHISHYGFRSEDFCVPFKKVLAMGIHKNKLLIWLDGNDVSQVADYEIPMCPVGQVIWDAYFNSLDKI